ncbi:hypothetical protein AHAS_Ahas13G0293000 [Arachis hypogaea]
MVAVAASSPPSRSCRRVLSRRHHRCPGARPPSLLRGQQRERTSAGQGCHQGEELCSTPPSPPSHNHHCEGSVAVIPVSPFVPFVAVAVAEPLHHRTSSLEDRMEKLASSASASGFWNLRRCNRRCWNCYCWRDPVLALL